MLPDQTAVDAILVACDAVTNANGTDDFHAEWTGDLLLVDGVLWISFWDGITGLAFYGWASSKGEVVETLDSIPAVAEA